MNRSEWLKSVSRLWLSGAVLFVSLGYGTQVAPYVSHTQINNVITILCTSPQKVRITVCTPTIVKVDYDPRGTFASTQDMLSADFTTKNWGNPTATVSDKGTSIEIATGKLTVQIQKSPLRITYLDEAGATITGDAGPMAVGATETKWVQLTKAASEHFFGWGMPMAWYKDVTMRSLDKAGKTYSARHTEAPFMYSTGGYGIFCLFGTGSWWDDKTKGPGYDLTTSASYWPDQTVVMNYLSYYFIAGTSYAQVIDGYTQVSGRPPKLGKKLYTVWRDVMKYNGVTATNMREFCDSWRNGRFPMDVIRMDEYFDWGKIAYATPPNQSAWNSEVPLAIKYYKDKGFLFGGMVNGWGCTGCCGNRNDDVLVEDTIRAQYAVDHGFDFAWYDCMNYHTRAKAKTEYDVWLRANRGDETKTMVSLGWFSVSSQAFPAGHTGDALFTCPEWLVFPATLEQHIAGYAQSFTDLGEGNPWNYIGCALRPVISHHQAGAAGGFWSTKEDFRVWELTPDIQNSLRKWENFHYRFIPYLFTYGVIANKTGMPIWRPMVAPDPKDAATYSLDRQCYVGDNIIISPYYPDGDATKGTRTGIYLPKDTWYDYFEGTKYTGPTSPLINYKVDPGTGTKDYKLPMFVRAGTIIPLMDTMLFIGEKPETLLTVQTWPMNGTATAQQSSFTLFEDEGTWNIPTQTRAAESKTTFVSSFADDGTKQLTKVVLGAFAGSAYCPAAASRKYKVEIHNVKSVIQVKSGSTPTWTTPITLVQYNSGVPGFCWDATKGGVCYVNAVGNAATGFSVFASNGIIDTGTSVIPVAINTQKSVITRGHGSIAVAIPFDGSHSVDVLNVQGRVIAQRSGTGAASYVIPLNRNTTQFCIVKISTKGHAVIKKIMP